eukprot:TRINITY_DN10896_c0_g1_i1.p1 TRINITY_DN10896_c0_g1~~TRINITY_DN10896_c0_g1_i1.p1  ORF type:complete len:775 (-),score=154.21 TRINITY_DN10896_c0_g1_i1:67-2391(-)
MALAAAAVSTCYVWEHGSREPASGRQAVATAATDVVTFELVSALQEQNVRQLVVAGANELVSVAALGTVTSYAAADGRELGVASPGLEPLRGVHVVQVSCGALHQLFLTATGQLYACGDNSDGQLGIGSRVADASSSPRPVHVPQLQQAATRFVQISSGGRHNLAVTSAGQVFSWGYARNGRCGHGETEDMIDAPRRLSLPQMVGLHPDRATRIAKVVCGWSHSLILVASTDSDADPDIVPTHTAVLSFGKSDSGQCGHGMTADQLTPKAIAGLPHLPVLDIAAGYYHSVCVVASGIEIAKGGTVYSWGGGSEGQLGLGDAHDRYAPRLVASLKSVPVNTVHAGSFVTHAHSNAVQRLYSWGRCGPEDVLLPREIRSMNDLRIVHISAGADRTAVVVDGCVERWSAEERVVHSVLGLPVFEQFIAKFACTLDGEAKAAGALYVSSNSAAFLSDDNTTKIVMPYASLSSVERASSSMAIDNAVQLFLAGPPPQCIRLVGISEPERLHDVLERWWFANNGHVLRPASAAHRSGIVIGAGRSVRPPAVLGPSSRRLSQLPRVCDYSFGSYVISHDKSRDNYGFLLPKESDFLCRYIDYCIKQCPIHEQKKERWHSFLSQRRLLTSDSGLESDAPCDPLPESASGVDPNGPEFPTVPCQHPPLLTQAEADKLAIIWSAPSLTSPPRSPARSGSAEHAGSTRATAPGLSPGPVRRKTSAPSAPVRGRSGSRASGALYSPVKLTKSPPTSPSQSAEQLLSPRQRDIQELTALVRQVGRCC